MKEKRRWQMSCRVKYGVKSTMIALCSPLLRWKHEFGAGWKMCIVRSHFLKFLHCAGVFGVSRDVVDQVCILTARSIQYNKAGTWIRKRVWFCCRIRIKEGERTLPLACGFPKILKSPGQCGSVPRLGQGWGCQWLQNHRASALGESGALWRAVGRRMLWPLSPGRDQSDMGGQGGWGREEPGGGESSWKGILINQEGESAASSHSGDGEEAVNAGLE